MEIPWFERDRIPPGEWPFMSTIWNSLRAIHDDRITPSVDLTEGLGSQTITGCMEAYRQLLLRRTLDLAQSTVVTWNAGLAIGSVVSARALLETLAAFHDFLADATALANKADWAAIGGLVDARAWSTSDGENPATGKRGGQPRVGRQVERFIEAIEPGAMKFWHQICNVAHPNGMPMFHHFGRFEGGRFNERPAAESEPDLFPAIYNCLYAVCWLYGTAMDDFDGLLVSIRFADSEPPAAVR